MNLKEKKLYHQIHPLKLLTDWITGAISLYFLWFHELIIALLVMLIPPVVVSLLIVKFINLEKYKMSSVGKYIRMSMTPQMEVVRLVGFVMAILGAWYNMFSLIVFGIIVILFGWFQGLIRKNTVI